MSIIGDTDETTIERLEQSKDATRGALCADCEKKLCGHELLFNIGTGSHPPRCLACLASLMSTPAEVMRDQLFAHFERRACYAESWRRESEREGYGERIRPGCLWPDEGDANRNPSLDGNQSISTESVPTASIPVDDAWDSGNMSCGELLLALRLRIQTLSPRSVLKLTARTTGADQDIPAWCRVTGHRLLAEESCCFWIQRKD